MNRNLRTSSHCIFQAYQSAHGKNRSIPICCWLRDEPRNVDQIQRIAAQCIRRGFFVRINSNNFLNILSENISSTCRFITSDIVLSLVEIDLKIDVAYTVPLYDARQMVLARLVDRVIIRSVETPNSKRLTELILKYVPLIFKPIGSKLTSASPSFGKSTACARVRP